MCGIAGIISKDKDISPDEIVRMCDIIKHRGPDDEGYVCIGEDITPLSGEETTDEVYVSSLEYCPKTKVKDNPNIKGRIFLGHRRLSIIDVSVGGHQPMSCENGQYWIVMNGEIYNYLEIKKELVMKGYVFLSDSDTEVALKAYIEWGEDCQQRMKGMWALVIYDRRKQSLFMSRDRFGIKPLYYYINAEGSFYFASEIKQFTVTKGWKAELNYQRAADYLIFSVTDHTEETLFDGVYQIRPGCSFYYSINDAPLIYKKPVTQRQWYQPLHGTTTLSFEEAADKFRDLFKQSIEQHLQSDVPVGTALSGGLDSSSVVCQVERVFEEHDVVQIQKTFSSCAEDENFSERKWMDIVVKNTKVEPFFIYPAGKDVFTLTDKVLWHLDEPYVSQSAFLGYHVFAKASQEGIKVLLNGQGADEYLSGYTAYNSFRKFLLFKKLDFKQLKDEYKIKNLGSLFQHLRSINRFYLPSFILKESFKFSQGYRRLEKLIDLKKFKGKIVHPYVNIPFSPKVFNIAFSLLQYHPLPAFLRWEDRNSMAHAVEARVPFLDHEMVEFVTSLPVEYLDSKEENKKLLREAMRGLLPEEILNRKDKKGFMTPEERWVKIDFAEEFREEVVWAIQNSNGIVGPLLLDYFDAMVEDKVPFDLFYWRVILFSKWLRLFNVVLN